MISFLLKEKGEENKRTKREKKKEDSEDWIMIAMILT